MYSSGGKWNDINYCCSRNNQYSLQCQRIFRNSSYTCSTGGVPITITTPCIQNCTVTGSATVNPDTTTVPGSTIFKLTTVGSYTFTCPSAKTAQILIVGGGAGGVVYASSYSLDTTPYTVTVGTGGTSCGSSGGSSSFGSMTANGGGSGGTSSSSAGVSGGAGGSPTPPVCSTTDSSGTLGGGAGGIGISNPISGTGIAMIGGGGTTVNNCGLGGSGVVIIKY
jgi:hypothetical protein